MVFAQEWMLGYCKASLDSSTSELYSLQLLDLTQYMFILIVSNYHIFSNLLYNNPCIIVNPGSFAFQEMQDTFKKDEEDAGVGKTIARKGIWAGFL